MPLYRWLFLIAGSFVLLSVALAHLVSPYFLFFTTFVALNMIQAAFTRWCPMMWLLRRLGVRET
jgi:DUF2892 family protein